MRFVEGGQTLGSLLQGQPLPPSQISRTIGQIAAALDYAHSKDVIHRDVKPSNVLLDEHGNCLLSDFGLAKVLISSTQLTASGAFLGTPKYASPEQCLGSSEIDQRSDVYSLGVILYEMVTGRPPFDADTPMGVVIKHIHDPLPMPRTINPDLPEAVERVILKALSKEVDGRYSTAGELAQAYDTAVKEQVEDTGGLSTGPAPLTGETRPSAVPESLEKPIPRGYTKWIWPVVVGAALVFLAIFMIGSQKGDVPPAPSPIRTTAVAVVPDTEAPTIPDTEEPAVSDTPVAEEPSASDTPEPHPEQPTYTPNPTYTPLPTYTSPPPTKTTSPTDTVLPPTETERPTNTPQLEKPYVVADRNYFCRQSPNTNSEEHWMFMEGTKNYILGKSDTWWLIAVDDPSTRTKCCWVGGGNSGGDLSIVPIIDYEIDRMNCPPSP
jgi:serine/threonine-protein kinase